MSLRDVAIMAVIAVWVAPVSAGLLDGMCWFFAASQCTPVIWNDARMIFTFVWTIGVPVLGMLVLVSS